MIDREDFKYVKNILQLHNSDIDLEYLENIITACRAYPDRADDLIDSFSNNQIKAKKSLVNALESLDILKNNLNVVIWGSWYGSVLVPLLANKVKSIMCIDLDDQATKIARNLLFSDQENLKFNVCDVFEYKKDYIHTNLFINTSCEHMKPMKEWPWFDQGAMAQDYNKKVFRSPKLNDECYFAFQSNNMYGIEGHINCVNTIEDFENQLPERAEVLYREEVEDTRGIRYMLVGKFMPL